MMCTNATPDCRRAAGSLRSAYTIVEVLAVTAILTTLAGLMLPAVQSARESARAVTCRNHVRQIASAVLQHEELLGNFPSGGWGPGWLGVAERGSDSTQPGGWIFGVLPFVEAIKVRESLAGTTAASSAADYAACAATPVPVFACPSRRTAAPRPLAVTSYRTPFDTAVTITVGVVSDYAANGGSYATCPPLELLEKAVAFVDGSTKVTFCHVPGNDPKKQNTQSLSLSATEQGHDGHDLDHIGPCLSCDDDMGTLAADPASLAQGDQWRRIDPLGRLVLPDGGIPDLQDGLVARMSQTRGSAVRDGLSNTYLVGEKYVAADRYAAATDAGDNRTMTAGYSSSTVRWAYDPPAADAPGQSQPNVFGGPHSGGFSMAFADGSVQTVKYDIDPAVHRALAGRADRIAVTRPD